MAPPARDPRGSPGELDLIHVPAEGTGVAGHPENLSAGFHDGAEAVDAGRDCSDVHDDCGNSGAVWSPEKPCTPEAHRQAYTYATMLLLLSERWRDDRLDHLPHDLRVHLSE
jgi:hypothetical protein